MPLPPEQAAARLQEAVAAELPAELRTRTPEAATLHRLLGWRLGGRFRYGPTQRLPFDVVVVDETSMVSLTLMARLLEAVRPDDVFCVIAGKGSIVGERFVAHPAVRKIVFTGSTEVGQRIIAAAPTR